MENNSGCGLGGLGEVTLHGVIQSLEPWSVVNGRRGASHQALVSLIAESRPAYTIGLRLSLPLPWFFDEGVAMVFLS